MNVLLTSVGRRAYMVKYFKEAVGPLGQVHVCNSDDMTVAFCYADKCVISPIIYDEEYIPFLLKYCKENHIHILLSLFDIDLLVLARNKEKFARIGTRVIVSSPDFIEVCNDKWNTYLFLQDHGFCVPKTYASLADVHRALEQGELRFPVVVKPRFGCGSISVAIAQDMDDLTYLYRKCTRAVENSYLKYESRAVSEKLIFQECLKGQEYGADVINDLQGNLCNVIVRKKIAMRAGETDIAELVDEPVIRSEMERIGEISGHIGNLDCDIFLVDGKPYVLEMNARFGGGYPFSQMGGCNLPGAIVAWCRGETPSSSMLTARTGVRGYKELYITEA